MGSISLVSLGLLRMRDFQCWVRMSLGSLTLESPSIFIPGTPQGLMAMRNVVTTDASLVGRSSRGECNKRSVDPTTPHCSHKLPRIADSVSFTETETLPSELPRLDQNGHYDCGHLHPTLCVLGASLRGKAPHSSTVITLDCGSY